MCNKGENWAARYRSYFVMYVFGADSHFSFSTECSGHYFVCTVMLDFI